MTWKLQTPDRPGLAKLSSLHAELAELVEPFKALTISGLTDKTGYKAVHIARMLVRNRRVDVEMTRKELKADALEYGRAVDAEARKLTAILEPVEKHLQQQEEDFEAEKNLAKKAAENAHKAEIEKRIFTLADLGFVVNPLSVAEWSEEEYQANLIDAREEFDERAKVEAERRRVETEEKRKQAEESAKLAAERAEIDRLRSEQQAERLRIEKSRQDIAAEQRQLSEELVKEAERIEAGRRALEKAEYDRNHALEIEQVRKEAAEKARVEIEARLIREDIARGVAAKENEDRLRAEAEKAEQERPIRDRIERIAVNLQCIHVPEGAAMKKVKAVLDRAAEQIRKIAAGPLGEDQ